MELRHLRYFVATAELEHFGQASSRLNIVQPALSKQIRELEDEVGTPLFERLPRGVRLTRAGGELLKHAREILAKVPLAVEHARRVAHGEEGVLRLGFVDTAVYHPRLPRLIAAFRKVRPSVHLELVQGTSREQGELLAQGKLDIACVYHRPPQLAKVTARSLVTERVMLVTPVDHPYAQRRYVSVADLKDQPFVWIPRSLSPPYYDMIYEACLARGFQLRIVQEGGSDRALLGLAAAGAGLTFTLSSARHHKPESVSMLPIRDLRTPLRLEALWLEDSKNPALPTFVSLLPL